MEKISEQKINDLTRKHISRVFSKIEKEQDVPFWIKQIVKTEFWLLNQNIKSVLYSHECLLLDVKDKPWFPDGKKE